VTPRKNLSDIKDTTFSLGLTNQKAAFGAQTGC